MSGQSTKRAVRDTGHEAAPRPEATSKTSARTSASPRTTRDDVLLTRALDQELEWFFAYAEGALQREDVGILPNYVAPRILAGSPNDDAVRFQALELACMVRSCVRALSTRDASVLRAVYTPRRWPKVLTEAFATLTPVAVRLSIADDPWPERTAKKGFETAIASRLATKLLQKGRVPVARMREQARRLFGRAVGAYLKRRSEETPSLLASGGGM
jgi:hypothetical protein